MSPLLNELVELIADCMEGHRVKGESYCQECDQLIFFLALLKDLEEA